MLQAIEHFKSMGPSWVTIFDTPPLLITDDTTMLLPHMDAVLLVVEEGKTKAESIQQSIEVLKDSNLLGIALNKSASDQSSYYYG